VNPLELRLDDTGKESDSPVVGLGGFLARGWRGKRFADEWRHALYALGLPYFHMSEMENFKGPFRDWTPERKKEALRRLDPIIGRHVIGPVVCTLEMGAYRDQIKTAELRALVGSPIALVAKGVMLVVERWARAQREDAEVTYIVDFGIEEKGEVIALFERVTGDPELRRTLKVKGLRFERMKDSPGLQAADRHAYEGFKAVRDQVLDVDRRHRHIRKSAQSLLSQFGKQGTFDGRLDKGFLRKYVKWRKEGGAL
jgi:hypothetical protein